MHITTARGHSHSTCCLMAACTAVTTVFVLSLHVNKVVDKVQGARLCVGVQEGSCVLVHSAAGGCGMNALAICLAVGAIPVGTVGSPDKVSASVPAYCTLLCQCLTWLLTTIIGCVVCGSYAVWCICVCTHSYCACGICTRSSYIHRGD